MSSKPTDTMSSYPHHLPQESSFLNQPISSSERNSNAQKLTEKRQSPNLFGPDADSCLGTIEQEIYRHLNFTLGHHDQSC